MIRYQGIKQGQPLEDRERECLQFAGDGLTTEVIAVRMAYSKDHVNYLIGSACRKLGAKNRTQAIYLATRQGILTARDKSISG